MAWADLVTANTNRVIVLRRPCILGVFQGKISGQKCGNLGILRGLRALFARFLRVGTRPVTPPRILEGGTGVCLNLLISALAIHLLS